MFPRRCSAEEARAKIIAGLSRAIHHVDTLDADLDHNHVGSLSAHDGPKHETVGPPPLDIDRQYPLD
jgi:hypothetical protein